MGEMEKYRFAFVSPSIEIAKAVIDCIDPETEEMKVKLATMEEAVEVAKKLLSEGVEVIMGGGGTGSLMIKSIGQPVIKISRSHIDILRALIRAKEYGSFIGLTSFAEPTSGTELFEDLLSIKIRNIVFSTTQELTDGITRAVEEGIDCIVGGGICREIISSLGKPGIIVPPSKEVILDALQQARAIASARRKEREDTEQLRTILETIKEGVVVVDGDARVSTFNKAASEILGNELKSAVEQPFLEVVKALGVMDVLASGEPELDRIRRVRDVDLVVNIMPVYVDGRMQSAVVTFTEASKIQNIDRKLREKLYLKGFVAKYAVEHIKGQSPKIRKLIQMARKYAQTDETILIQGETGTGKEILAQSIHNLSKRKDKPFVAINCSALPESLLESELFGYEEGAFTGAKKGGKIGLFELANEGTIFLDEIADIPKNLQVRLLRVLEEKEVMRVGGDKIVPVDVRIISSTYKDLSEEVRSERFRMDLFYRLEVLKLAIPPLRERLKDLPCIVYDILYKYQGAPEIISKKMIECMEDYDWPGNIRELDSLIKRYVILLGDSKPDEKLFMDLFAELRGRSCVPREEGALLQGKISGNGSKTLKEQVETYESMVIEKTLEECHYNKKETAKRLGISLNTLWRKLNLPDTSF